MEHPKFCFTFGEEEGIEEGFASMSMSEESNSSGDNDSRRESFNNNSDSSNNHDNHDNVIINDANVNVCDKKLQLPVNAKHVAGTTKSETDSDEAGNAQNQQRVPRRKKKKRRMPGGLVNFHDQYKMTGDVLGEGSTGRVETCINLSTNVEYAVKIISKKSWSFSRAKVLKEIELYYLCQHQDQIIHLKEYFEDCDNFYLVFEKVYGGQLLDQIQKRVHFTEEEASMIVKDLALALKFLHQKGIAHRDLKPENILCVNSNNPWPVKLCDFDLCSSVHQTVTTPMLQSPVGSAEYMAPEIVNAFNISDTCHDYADDDDEELLYDKRCDLWSLGIITYILLCGYLPFAGHCDDPSCEWECGGECLNCQRSLFDAIRSGTLIFPEQHWSTISTEAKDLISKLLVRDASQRIDANSLLKHPWIVQGGSSKALETPNVLRRQTSVKEFSEFAGSALLIKRTMETSNNNNNNNSLMKKSATSNDLIFLNPNPMILKDRGTQGGKRQNSNSSNLQLSCTGSMRRQSSLFFPGDISNLRYEF